MQDLLQLSTCSNATSTVVFLTRMTGSSASSCTLMCSSTHLMHHSCFEKMSAALNVMHYPFINIIPGQVFDGIKCFKFLRHKSARFTYLNFNYVISWPRIQTYVRLGSGQGFGLGLRAQVRLGKYIYQLGLGQASLFIDGYALLSWQVITTVDVALHFIFW